MSAFPTIEHAGWTWKRGIGIYYGNGPKGEVGRVLRPTMKSPWWTMDDPAEKVTRIFPTAREAMDVLVEEYEPIRSDWYEVEVRLYQTKNWRKTLPLTDGVKDGQFSAHGDALVCIHEMKKRNDILYEEAEWRVVHYTREIMR